MYVFISILLTFFLFSFADFFSFSWYTWQVLFTMQFKKILKLGKNPVSHILLNVTNICITKVASFQFLIFDTSAKKYKSFYRLFNASVFDAKRYKRSFIFSRYKNVFKVWKLSLTLSIAHWVIPLKCFRIVTNNKIELLIREWNVLLLI